MPQESMMQDDAGSLDNVLSLDPNDDRWRDVVSGWEDGQTYQISGSIRQVSPGKYELVSLQSESAEEQTEAPEQPEGQQASRYPNPAVEKMMAEEAG